LPNDLVDRAIAFLSTVLPADWKVERQNRTSQQTGRAVDGFLNIITPGGVAGSFYAQSGTSMSPRDVQQLVNGPTLALQTQGTILLAIAPWLSQTSQKLLTEAGWSYVDLTGNVRISVGNPPLFVHLQGAKRDPAPKSRGTLRLGGARTGRLLRFLCDVRPPYGVREVAAATGLNQGWVSEILKTLYNQGLVDKSGPRGVISAADPPSIIRRWAETYDLFRTNDSQSFIAPDGARRCLEELVEVGDAAPRWELTGSFVAVTYSPVAAPGLLAIYTEDRPDLARRLRLLPADTGADVVLLSPFDAVVRDRSTVRNGIPTVAPSQLAVDCLTGNGRMPAEGEAILAWMTEHETEWRIPSIRHHLQ
jgi:hypothetical protein